MSHFSLKKTYPNLSSPVDYFLYQNYNGNPHTPKSLIKRRIENAKNLYNKDLFAHYGCVNAVEFSNDGEYLISGGDDKRVLLWNINKVLSYNYKPIAMKGEHHSNIFCLSFDSQHKRIFSAGNDEQVILHDAATGELVDVFLHNEAVYGLSVDPRCQNTFASACENGCILIWDIRLPASDAITLASYSSGFHAVMYNPAESRLLATANAKEGVGLWDIRKPRSCLMKYGTHYFSQGAMNVCFNKIGRSILALRRRLPPVLYEITSPRPAVEFDHPEYYNSCTMKSCCFAGDSDQFVLSGSDDFKLYMWQVPDDVINKKSQWINKAHLTIRGHRSIVNQVRYNNTYGILASSGVEKVIKLWSIFPICGNLKNSYFKNALRKVYTHEEYLNLVVESGQFMTHDYSHHSVQEDPRMMAFFDSLVQRDIEGWSSSDSSTNVIDNLNTSYEVVSSHSSSTSSYSSSDSENELNEISKEKIVNNKDLRRFDDSNESTDEQNVTKGDLLSDRISWLIAKKRKRQLHGFKISKNRYKHKKRNILRRKHFKETKTIKPIKFLQMPFYSSNTESVTDILNYSTKSTVNDKRKTLQKKRAKLLRLPDISDHSSDSDASNETKRQFTNEKISISKDTSSTSVTNNLKSEDKTMEEVSQCSTKNSNTVGDDIKHEVPLEENKSSDSNVPGSSTNKLNKSDSSIICFESSSSSSLSLNANVPSAINANGSSVVNANGTSTISLNSNGSLFLQPKNKKHHSRNYRKRSTEDVQDDR